jgi:hypothetical protein
MIVVGDLGDWLVCLFVCMGFFLCFGAKVWYFIEKRNQTCLLSCLSTLNVCYPNSSTFGAER